MSLEPMPGPLEDWVGMLEADIRDASPHNLTVLKKNHVTWLRTILGRIEESDEISAAAANLSLVVGELIRAIQSEGILYDNKTQPKKQAALHALQLLKLALRKARPNDVSRALGLDW